MNSKYNLIFSSLASSECILQKISILKNIGFFTILGIFGSNLIFNYKSGTNA